MAETASEAATSYESVNIRRTTCRIVLRSGELKAQLGEATAADGYREFLKCQRDVEADAKASYARVSAKLKTAAARSALKEYQAAVLTALAGNDSKTGETERMRTQRQGALDEKVESAWQRLQLEL